MFGSVVFRNIIYKYKNNIWNYPSGDHFCCSLRLGRSDWTTGPCVCYLICWFHDSNITNLINVLPCSTPSLKYRWVHLANSTCSWHTFLLCGYSKVLLKACLQIQNIQLCEHVSILEKVCHVPASVDCVYHWLHGTVTKYMVIYLF